MVLTKLLIAIITRVGFPFPEGDQGLMLNFDDHKLQMFEKACKIVKSLLVKPEPTKMKHLSGATL